MSGFDSGAFDTSAFDDTKFDFSSVVAQYMTFQQWIHGQPGLTGNTNDKLNQYLRTLGYTGSNPDMMKSWLIASGYTQTNLTDQMKDWSANNLS